VVLTTGSPQPLPSTGYGLTVPLLGMDSSSFSWIWTLVLLLSVDSPSSSSVWTVNSLCDLQAWASVSLLASHASGGLPTAPPHFAHSSPPGRQTSSSRAWPHHCRRPRRGSDPVLFPSGWPPAEACRFCSLAVADLVVVVELLLDLVHTISVSNLLSSSSVRSRAPAWPSHAAPRDCAAFAHSWPSSRAALRRHPMRPTAPPRS